VDITITMSTDNANFEDEGIADALRRLADRIEKNGIGGVSKVVDLNGNSIGSVDFNS